MKEVTIVLISYKSENIINNFIKNIPKDIPAIIVENSNNHLMKTNIENNYKNIKVYLKKNDGVSSSLNFAAKKILTKYFLQISPDIKFNFNDLHTFLSLAKKLNDKFSAIGPRFINVRKKSHKQINKNLKFDKINSVHGSCMFINKKCFLEIGGFDENIFLYFEETEYCYRAKKKKYLSYQTNEVTVETAGRSVELTKEDQQKISNLLMWHFIWSKFYFYKKKYGLFLSNIYFIPIIIRIIFKIFLYKITKNSEKVEKYKFRLDGLLNSIRGKNSFLRIDF